MAYSAYITPNEFLEQVDRFEKSGKDVKEFLKLTKGKGASAYISIKCNIDGKYKTTYIICKKLELKYGVASLEKRRETSYYKPNLCISGDATFEMTVEGKKTIQKYGEYRLKMHELLQLNKGEIKKIFPKLDTVETAVRFAKENKETGLDEDLEIPEISVKIKMKTDAVDDKGKSLKNPENRDDSYPDVEIRDLSKITMTVKDGRKIYTTPECLVDGESVNNKNIHLVFASGSKISFLEDVTQGFYMNNTKKFYLLANLCCKFADESKKIVYVNTVQQTKELEEDDMANLVDEDVMKNIKETSENNEEENLEENLENSTENKPEGVVIDL